MAHEIARITNGQRSSLLARAKNVCKVGSFLVVIFSFKAYMRVKILLRNFSSSSREKNLSSLQKRFSQFFLSLVFELRRLRVETLRDRATFLSILLGDKKEIFKEIKRKLSEKIIAENRNETRYGNNRNFSLKIIFLLRTFP